MTPGGLADRGIWDLIEESSCNELCGRVLGLILVKGDACEEWVWNNTLHKRGLIATNSFLPTCTQKPSTHTHKKKTNSWCEVCRGWEEDLCPFFCMCRVHVRSMISQLCRLKVTHWTNGDLCTLFFSPHTHTHMLYFTPTDMKVQLFPLKWSQSQTKKGDIF